MTISFIVAISEDNAIGRGNALPWHLPEDLKFFKRTTLGKPVIMGRKTYEALGKPLPGRLNVVLSRNAALPLPEGVLLYADINEALEHMRQQPSEEVFIIGGGKIFEAAMNLADRMYVTRVHTDVPDADAFFPPIDHTHWRLVWEERHSADDKHKYGFDFQQYERIEM